MGVGLTSWEEENNKDFKMPERKGKPKLGLAIYLAEECKDDR